MCIHTENQDQVSECPSAPWELTFLSLTLGHLHYCLTGVPPQTFVAAFQSPLPMCLLKDI